jgi:small subunit ribosomal protein S2
MEGAAEYQQKVMINADKQEAKPTENREASPDKKRRGKPSVLSAEEKKKSDGPVVVKVTKPRKLVAAGMAEVVEIQAELENTETPEGTEEESN